MTILGMDTATRATAVAVVGHGAPVERRDDPPAGRRPGHAAQLLSLSVEALGAAGLGWAQIDRIVVGVGPGTFTGLRIGIATARALGQARGIPVVGVSTLQSLALLAAPAAHAAGVNHVAAVIDARRRELFAAAWSVHTVSDPEAAPVMEARPYRPDALEAALAGLGTPVLAVGDGAVPFRELLERADGVVPGEDSELHRVSAVGHCRLGAALKAGSAAAAATPAYLRIPDAELARQAAEQTV